MVLHFRNVARGGEIPAIQEDDAAAQRLDLVQDVTGDQNRRAVRRHLAEQFGRLGAGLRV